MGTKLIINHIKLERIHSMHDQHYSYGIIAVETGLSTNVVRRVVKEYLDNKEPVQIEIIMPTLGKYDFLFEEKMNEGRMYKEYKK